MSSNTFLSHHTQTHRHIHKYTPPRLSNTFLSPHIHPHTHNQGCQTPSSLIIHRHTHTDTNTPHTQTQLFPAKVVKHLPLSSHTHTHTQPRLSNTFLSPHTHTYPQTHPTKVVKYLPLSTPSSVLTHTHTHTHTPPSLSNTFLSPHTHIFSSSPLLLFPHPFLFVAMCWLCQHIATKRRRNREQQKEAEAEAEKEAATVTLSPGISDNQSIYLCIYIFSVFALGTALGSGVTLCLF